MNTSKPCRRIKQAATKVKGLSSVILIVTKVDGFHDTGRQHCCVRIWRERGGFVGVLGRGMLEEGKHVNLGDPLRALWQQAAEYQQTSQSRRGCWDHVAEVGSAGSTPSAGKPRTWGSGRRGEASGNVFGIHASQRAK